MNFQSLDHVGSWCVVGPVISDSLLSAANLDKIVIFEILISYKQEPRASLLNGHAGTPYENGVFRMKLLLSHDFPHSPPKGYFLTRIFHPNIASNGEICVNTLKKDWNPSLGLRHVLTVVRCLLIEPFPESALNEQAGKMLLENYEEYARHARIYTGIHAKPKPKFKTGAISESTTALNVDQSIGDQKSVAVGAVVPLQSPLAPCTTASKGGNSQDQPAAVGRQEENGCKKKELKEIMMSNCHDGYVASFCCLLMNGPSGSI
ncbi:hypothetical protein NC651_034880 [Populus alba x Populus x berolinensis]|nr:hypothetical protein NC651_034880 [Populus alba x Populus x berolinensis]